MCLKVFCVLLSLICATTTFAQTRKEIVFDFNDLVGSKTNYEYTIKPITLKISSIAKNASDVRIGGENKSFSIKIVLPNGYNLEQVKIIYREDGLVESDYLTADEFPSIGTFKEERPYAWWSSTTDVTTVLIEGHGKKRIKSITIIPRELTPPTLSTRGVYSYHGKNYFINRCTLGLSASKGEIRYTIDGIVPHNYSPRYTGTIVLSEATTIKAVTLDNYGNRSTITTLYVEPYAFVGNGTVEKPYAVSDIAFLTHPDVEQIPNQDVWVKGQILGNQNEDGVITPHLERLTDIILGQENDHTAHLTFSLPFDNLLSQFSDKRIVSTPVALYGRFVDDAVTQSPKLVSEDFKCMRFLAEGGASFVISSYGYATFATYLPYTLPENVEAAIALSNDTSDVTFNWLYQPGDIIPANTALLLRGDEATYPCELVVRSSLKSDKIDTGNLLVGNTKTTDLLTNNATYTFYGLTTGGQGFGFYKRQTDGQMMITPYHCGLGVNRQPHFAPAFVEPNGMITAVQTLRKVDVNTKIYTIDGRYLGTMLLWPTLHQGIYVVNGKIMIK